MDTVWHYAPDSKNVPPKGDGATVLNPMSKDIARDTLGLLWVFLGSIGLHGILLGPLESSVAASGILWGSLGKRSGVLWEVLWSFWDSFGDQGGTKWETNETKSNWDQVGLSGDQLGPSGDQIGTKCGANRTK